MLKVVHKKWTTLLARVLVTHSGGMTGSHIRELPSALVALALAQGNVLTGRQAAGFLDERQFPAAVRRRLLVRLWWSVYCLPDSAEDIQTQLAGADLALGTTAVPCLHTAAMFHGFDMARDNRLPNQRLHVLAPARHHSKSARLSLHRLTLLDHTTLWNGRPTTSGTETAFTIAARMPDRMRAVGVLDAALRAGATTYDKLAEYAPMARYSGARLVRSVVGRADPRAESPPESWLRLACIEFGLPEPEPQVEVVGADGRRYRMDLGWRDVRVAAEYDGQEFHTGEHLTKDRHKLNAVTAAGWAVYSVTNASFWNNRDRVLGQIRAEIARRRLPRSL
ncbi:hypothetical protein D1871_17320 [Nakamurella silvestris]|nr:hypothetical protein D1871_17320 [Nakamurella silvestris]